jgi:hypothetical protein
MYPQIQSSTTIMELVNKIEKMQSDRYDQLIKNEVILREIRFRNHNPWRWYWVTPEIPDDIQKRLDINQSKR